MLRLKLTAVPDRLWNKEAGGDIARFAPEFAPAGAISVHRQSSIEPVNGPVQKIQVTSVGEVVVSENAKTFALFVGVMLIVP